MSKPITTRIRLMKPLLGLSIGNYWRDTTLIGHEFNPHIRD